MLDEITRQRKEAGINKVSIKYVQVSQLMK
jgi:hypothetical protein